MAYFPDIPEGTGIVLTYLDTHLLSWPVQDALDARYGGGAEDVGFDIIISAGQSNAAGYNGPVAASTLDPVDPRIWQYTPGGGQIIQAIDPLSGPADASMSRLVAPVSEFARNYVRAVANSRRVLIVQCAVGATGLVGERWDKDAKDLYLQTVTYANRAVEAAGPNSRVVAFLWVQGEHDAGTTLATEAAYAADLDQLVTGLRTDIDTADDAAFIIGSMVPEWREAPNGTSIQIHAAHVDTPARLDNAFFADGPRFQNDGAHYTAVGTRALGRAMFYAWKEPTSAGAPDQVEGLYASVLSTTAFLHWEPVLANPAVTDYVIQWRVSPAGSWNTFSHAESAAFRAVLTVSGGGTYDFRVAAVNSDGTGPYSAIVAQSASAAADTFTRANSTTTLGTTETGSLVWEVLGGTWGISSNQAYMPLPIDHGVAVVEMGAGNHRVGAKVTGGSGTCYPGVCARVVDVNHMYFLLFTSATAWGIYRRNPGDVNTLLKSGTATAGQLVEFSCKEVGNSTRINAYVGGVLNGTEYSDTSYMRPYGTKVGLRTGMGGSGTPRWDDFTATVIT